MNRLTNFFKAGAACQIVHVTAYGFAIRKNFLNDTFLAFGQDQKKDVYGRCYKGKFCYGFVNLGNLEDPNSVYHRSITQQIDALVLEAFSKANGRVDDFLKTNKRCYQKHFDKALFSNGEPEIGSEVDTSMTVINSEIMIANLQAKTIAFLMRLHLGEVLYLHFTREGDELHPMHWLERFIKGRRTMNSEVMIESLSGDGSWRYAVNGNLIFVPSEEALKKLVIKI